MPKSVLYIYLNKFKKKKKVTYSVLGVAPDTSAFFSPSVSVSKIGYIPKAVKPA